MSVREKSQDLGNPGGGSLPSSANGHLAFHALWFSAYLQRTQVITPSLHAIACETNSSSSLDVAAPVSQIDTSFSGGTGASSERLAFEA